MLNDIDVKLRREGVARGGYIAKRETGKLDLILLSCGSELQHAMKAAGELGEGTRVVSMPCFERFERQSAEYREEVLPPSCRRRVAIEAGVPDVWYQYVGLDGKVIGLHRFGMSGPGDEVTMYQHVTLGGTNPSDGVAGKRHPTIGDGAIIGSGAAVLGPVHVGARARIGANAVVTRDVPEGATMVGIPARSTLVSAEQSAAGRFLPYGTPCSENFDPATQKLELLQCELEQLRARVAELIEQRDSAKPATRKERGRA
jgi:carbonic anhydrase/acetyltransferase-like protein (isoleucine patch superfamily)